MFKGGKFRKFLIFELIGNWYVISLERSCFWNIPTFEQFVMCEEFERTQDLTIKTSHSPHQASAFVMFVLAWYLWVCLWIFPELTSRHDEVQFNPFNAFKIFYSETIFVFGRCVQSIDEGSF